MSIMLAGIPIDERLVLDLARRLRDPGLDDTAQTLEDAYDNERRVAALTIEEREARRRGPKARHGVSSPPDAQG
jgi:hypothetical protein